MSRFINSVYLVMNPAHLLTFQSNYPNRLENALSPSIPPSFFFSTSRSLRQAHCLSHEKILICLATCMYKLVKKLPSSHHVLLVRFFLNENVLSGLLSCLLLFFLLLTLSWLGTTVNGTG